MLVPEPPNVNVELVSSINYFSNEIDRYTNSLNQTFYRVRVENCKLTLSDFGLIDMYKVLNFRELRMTNVVLADNSFSMNRASAVL